MKLVYNSDFCELYNGNMLDMVDSGCIKPISIDCIEKSQKTIGKSIEKSQKSDEKMFEKFDCGI